MSNAPQRFRKKPVAIEAMQWPEHGDTSYESVCRRAAIHRWVNGSGGKTEVVHDRSEHHDTEDDIYAAIVTLEGNMKIGPGDWVIRGVHGEFYPCKPDIFAATYDAVAG